MDRFHSQLHKNGHSSYTKIDIAVTQRRISSLIFIIPFSVPHTNLFGNCLMDLQGWTHQNLWQTLEEMTVIYADPGRNVFKKKKKKRDTGKRIWMFESSTSVKCFQVHERDQLNSCSLLVDEVVRMKEFACMRHWACFLGKSSTQIHNRFHLTCNATWCVKQKIGF